MIQITKIISGGQTGADRAALDAAISCGFPHGGWCPAGRLAEDGVIPEKYHLKETQSRKYPSRTRANIREGDLTLIFFYEVLSGGSLYTKEQAVKQGKPCLLVDLSLEAEWITHLEKLCQGNSEFVLNIAGPRESSCPGIYDLVYQQVHQLLTMEGCR